jgi:hypothetical protein
MTNLIENQMISLRRVLIYGCLAVGLAGLTACAGSGMGSYSGRLAKPESTVRLSEGGPHELKWQTNDLILDALVVLERNELDLAGTVNLQNRLRHYPIVAYLRISLHVLDGDGIILATHPLWSAGQNAEHFFINWAFQRRFPVPPDTRAVTFSYRGRMRDGGGLGPGWDRQGDTTSWDFWHTP